jgi:hypothetical protein
MSEKRNCLMSSNLDLLNTWWWPFPGFWNSLFLPVSLFFFYSLFTCAYIVWATSPPCPLPTPSPPIPLSFMQNLFCPFFQFCWREDISNNKKIKAFLLVEIRIAKQRLLALLSCTNVLNPSWFINSTWPFH